MTKNLHLICNAHIDPVWLWDMEEGITTALSTFRTAAAFCEAYDGLVFNHNEALLYEWIEDHEPRLFDRIRSLVKKGNWHIMGGWYLQPDCNMPSGESLLRQMEAGRKYFKEKFGVTNSTAVNFDSFGHSRGLVQLLAKAGYDSYLFCRPGQGDCPLPEDDFIWEGFDGSRVMAHRADTYGTLMGEAGKTIQNWLKEQGNNPSLQNGCILWGVGNHGGGPSRIDLEEIGRLMKAGDPDAEKSDLKYPDLEYPDADSSVSGIGTSDGTQWMLIHSTPEAYFSEHRQLCMDLEKTEPIVKRDLNAWAVGCYTSQIRIKQKHRELEGELSVTEKMLSQAVALGLLTYPEEELQEAQKALLFCEFHDILPGTAIRTAEERSLQTLSYGLEIVKKWKRRAFFALMNGEEAAQEGEYPILIYNPHPYRLEGDFTCEFQLANQNWTDKYALPYITQNEKELISQVEKEACNLNLDWRKRVTFHASLAPSSMNRFSARIRMIEQTEWVRNSDRREGVWHSEERRAEWVGNSDRRGRVWHSPEQIVFDNGMLYVVVNRKTGLLDTYRVNGRDYLKAGGCALTVMETDCDPWGMNRKSYRQESGRFVLMDKEEGSRFSGVYNDCHGRAGTVVDSVRIIENGPVRTVVEAVFTYESSKACINYILPVQGTAITVEIKVNWTEKGKFLKFEIPTCLKEAKGRSETAYGVVDQEADGNEKVFHRWCGLWDSEENSALTVLNKGNYGVDFLDGTMRVSLIHSAVYSAHPIGDRPLLVQDRYLPYIDQGEREFSFVIQGGNGAERLEQVMKEAVVFQEEPVVLQAFPSGEGNKQGSVLLVDDPAVILSAWRKTAGQEAYVIRLFESTGCERKVKICLPLDEYEQELVLQPFELRTCQWMPGEAGLKDCDIL